MTEKKDITQEMFYKRFGIELDKDDMNRYRYNWEWITNTEKLYNELRREEKNW